MRDRLKYQEEQFNFMADALTERCWVCTKLCDDERGCIVAPEAYAGHDVLACSDNHFNRAYEMAMGIKPANRTFYDFARVAERRDEGRGEDYGFRIQEIIFEPNFPPYRRDELSKSLRAETLSDEEYRQLLKEIMLSTQSKGEFEWAVSEIRKLNKKGAETFEAKGGKRMYCPNCEKNRTWSSAFKKERMDHSKGEKPRDFRFYVCQKCDYAYDPKTGKKMEDNWREMFGYDAESFEADCRDCYGTGGLYDSRLGIDDECASCGGTGVMEAETFEEKIDIDDFNKVADAIQAVGQPATVLFETKFGTPKIVVVLGDDIYDDENVEIVFDILDDLKIPFNSSSVVGDTTTLERKEYDRLRKINGGHKDFLAETFEAQMPFEGAVEQMDRHYSELGKKANKSDIYAKLVAWNGIEKMGQIKKAIEAFYNTKLEAESFEAESVSDLELKKDSCCCGATKKTPCVCMILGSDCSAKKPMCACYRLKAIQQKDEKGAETFEAKGDDKYYINNRPQWMPKLMKDSVENEEEGTYNRHDKGYVAGLFLKSVKDSRLNGILKQTNYQDSDVVGFIMPFDLITRKLAKDYEPLILKDNFGKSKKYLVINGTPYNYDIFNSMLMRLPPTTEVRISGKPKYPLMFEFKFLNEHYLMFLAPYVGDDFDASQHGDYAKEVMSKSGAGFGFKSPLSENWEEQKKMSKELKDKQLREDIEKVIAVGHSYDPSKEPLLLSPPVPQWNERKWERGTVEESSEGNDPDFDPEKADRDNDGEISDWERAVGNAVAKGIREHKERKEAESFGAWDANCSLCNGTGWMPKKGDPKKDAKLAKLLGLSIDELALTPCKAGGKSMGCWSENNSSRLRRLQRAESRPASYMVKSDAHKLNKASKRIHDKADKNREYPEWWKSKLSVARNNADQLADFLDYAVVEGIFESEGDHDHEEIDELIDKLNTVVDFAITFVHDGGYGGEPKGILIDEDLGIKTEVVHYIEGSIQLNLVRDIDTNELLSVRFSLTGDPDQTPIVYLPLPEEITTVPEDDRVSAKN